MLFGVSLPPSHSYQIFFTVILLGVVYVFSSFGPKSICEYILCYSYPFTLCFLFFSFDALFALENTLPNGIFVLLFLLINSIFVGCLYGVFKHLPFHYPQYFHSWIFTKCQNGTHGERKKETLPCLSIEVDGWTV